MTYNEFIQNILDTRGRFGIPDGEYKERHHIVPKCLGGTNDRENLVDLYAREHYEAHRLLAGENPDNDKLVSAWWMMCSCKRGCQKREVFSPQEYEEARMFFAKKASERIKGEKHPMYGRHLPEETKRKMSAVRKGRPSPFRGLKGLLSPVYSRKASEESRQKMSEAKKGKYLRGDNPHAKRVVCEGVVYGCVQDCADKYCITASRLRHLLGIRFEDMPQKWQDRDLRYYEEQRKEVEDG